VDTHVAERTQAAHAGAAREDPSEHGAETRQAGVTSPPTQDRWRWIPDAGEVNPPVTPVEQGDATWGNLIRGLAWASARFWG
jgi:hypothetical protein